MYPVLCEADLHRGFVRVAVVLMPRLSLQDIEERVMIIRDQVLTRTCQLYYDYFGPHNRDLYGEAYKQLIHCSDCMTA
jgi:hypothetical protein